jgi:hypothetical protein
MTWPAWRGAGSAFDLRSAFAYVHSFTEQRDNLSEAAAEIQTALATLIALAVDSMPADRAERHRSPLRLSYIAAMVNGVLQARTMHERIETELQELDKPEKIKRAITEARAWGWRFTHPENTIRFHEPSEPIETPPCREPDAQPGPPPTIAGDFETWTPADFYRAADFRIFSQNGGSPS